MKPIERYSEASIPTRFGDMRVVVYREVAEPRIEHVAVVRGDVGPGGVAGTVDRGVLCRVHSECLTSEVLGSLKCDCRTQLDAALERIASEGRGVLVYLRQEGRGIGLGNKIRAYALQAEGKDTVEANVALGFAIDLRTYELAGAMLRDLGVSRVRLLTNNPEKLHGLAVAGIEVVEQLAHWSPDTEHNREYLETKRTKLRHLSSDSAKDPVKPA